MVKSTNFHKMKKKISSAVSVNMHTEGWDNISLVTVDRSSTRNRSKKNGRRRTKGSGKKRVELRKERKILKR